tara:strand:+ start:339 stop:1238 length:900 start_codon:yes stop_codon:yes gene_type:complete
MSILYRKKRIKKIIKYWDFKEIHDLMVEHNLNKSAYKNFKHAVKNYISKAMNIDYEKNDKLFIKNIDLEKKNLRLRNITPNGAVVPKREFHLEYNIVLREWSEIVKNFTKNKKNLLKKFRTTPNIRIKFGDEIKKNIKRPLNTSLPHSDAWVEGPWGMNCFFPIIGDIKKNNLVYYEPIKFREEFLGTAKTYNEMQWVLKYYKKIKFTPKLGRVYVSDYALIHNTNRKPQSGTRISIDTTIFVGNHNPHKDRIREYRGKIPKIGIDEFVDAGQYENQKPVGKISTFSHYASKALKTIKL